jgi:hypothetical protein
VPFDHEKSASSPYINRFLQPDSIIPNPANPQSLNRFGYVLNNPIRFNDPSGHVCTDPDDLWSPSCDGSGGPPPNTPAPLQDAPVVITNPDPLDEGLKQKRPRRNDLDENSEMDFSLLLGLHPYSCNAYVSCQIINEPQPPLSIIENYCSGISSWACAAMFTQDLAFLVDLVFSGVELALFGVGCFAGGLAGCQAGLAAGITLFNITGANTAESYLSFTSLVFTVADDFDRTGWFGDASFTSAVTFLAGGINPDPTVDLIIDGYATGYNHGVFNDLNTIIFGGPIFKP